MKELGHVGIGQWNLYLLALCTVPTCCLMLVVLLNDLPHIGHVGRVAAEILLAVEAVGSVLSFLD